MLFLTITRSSGGRWYAEVLTEDGTEQIGPFETFDGVLVRLRELGFDDV